MNERTRVLSTLDLYVRLLISETETMRRLRAMNATGPLVSEVAKFNYFSWREEDKIRNSILVNIEH